MISVGSGPIPSFHLSLVVHTSICSYHLPTPYKAVPALSPLASDSPAHCGCCSEHFLCQMEWSLQKELSRGSEAQNGVDLCILSDTEAG